VDVSGNHLDSEHGIAVMVMDPSYGNSGGSLLRNLVRTGDTALRIEGGAWEIFDNYIRTSTNVPTLMVLRKAQVKAAWNVRGLRNAIPTDRGSVGDVALDVAGSSPSLGWWFDPAAHEGEGRWAPFEAIVPRPAGRGPAQAWSLRLFGRWSELSRSFMPFMRATRSAWRRLMMDTK
jgi:hypothetical protein